MRDIARHARFRQETRLGISILAAGFRQNLDGHSPTNDCVAGAVDVRHAAAQKLLKLVFADLCGQLHLRVILARRSPALWGTIAGLLCRYQTLPPQGVTLER